MDKDGNDISSSQEGCEDIPRPRTLLTDKNHAVVGYPGSGNTLLWYSLEIASGHTTACEVFKG